VTGPAGGGSGAGAGAQPDQYAPTGQVGEGFSAYSQKTQAEWLAGLKSPLSLVLAPLADLCTLVDTLPIVKSLMTLGVSFDAGNTANILHGLQQFSNELTQLICTIAGDVDAQYIIDGANNIMAAANANPFYTTILAVGQAIAGISGNLVVDLINGINHWLGDLITFLGNPAGLGYGLVTGVIPAWNIAGLDATKIISGQFPQNMIIGLETDLANLWAAVGSGSVQAVWDAILTTVGFPAGTGTATDVTNYFNDLLAMLGLPPLTSTGFNPSTAVSTFITTMMNPLNLLAPMNPATSLLYPVNIPGLDASKIVSGVLAVATIPFLPAAIITSGVFNAAQIPGLDASKIVSGVLGAAQIPSLPAGWGKTIDGAVIVNATAIETNINNELVNLENSMITNLGAVGSGYAAAAGALNSIPFANILAPWLSDIGAAIQSLTDQLTSGLSASAITGSNPGQAGQAATSVVNSVNSVTAIAGAHATFISNQAITNPAMWGIDPTGSASFPLSTVAASSPVPTINITSAAAAGCYIDTPFGGMKQSVAWLGDGTITGTYGIYINVYSVDPSTNLATFLWSSGNIVSAVSGGSTPLWNYANIPAANYINTAQGNKYYAEFQVLGPGTYKIVGINGSWLNANSNVAVGTMGATRTTAGNLASVTANGPANVKNPSWTLTTAAGDNCVVVDLVGYSNASAITALAVTCAGVAMTQKSFIRYNTGALAWEYITQFELHNTGFAPFTAGAKTIAVTTTGGGTTGTQCGVQGVASSYQNISAVGTAATNTGTTANPNQTATGLTANSNTVAHSLLSTDGAAALTSPNQNVIASIGGSTVTVAELIQDQLAYAATVPFSGTAAAGSWGASLFTLTSAQTTPLQTPAAPFTPTLSNNTPWMMLCGAAGLSQIPTKTTQYTTAGNKTYTIPANATAAAQAGTRVFFDIAGIGGGAGSGGGINTSPTNISGGGGAGTWGGVTLQLGVDIPLTTTSFTVHVGAGGAAGAASSLTGSNGAATTATITGYTGTPISFAGGLAGSGATPNGGYNSDFNVYIDGAAPSPSPYTFNGAPYYGGVQAVYGSLGRTPTYMAAVPGNAAGGGAAAGDVTSSGTWPVGGAAGAPGYAAVTLYQS
jgi:hypothetical protein